MKRNRRSRLVARLAGWAAGGLLVLSGCESDVLRPRPPSDEIPLHLVDDWQRVAAWGDPADIAGGKVDGSSLVLKVRYGGGCRVHRWRVFASPARTLGPMPVYDLLLDHDANQDPCEAYVTDSLEVSLTPLHRVIPVGGTAFLWIHPPGGGVPVLQIQYTRKASF